ncbi:MAG TPA: MATE family efflux transporter [Acidobacteriaceae bacterium]|nr:MATE family efflux transporter [Acidobacteriaceae bacterium]
MRAADIRQELPPLLRLAAPLIAGELGWMSMSVVDTSMVGRLPHSAVPMAAAALAQVIFNTFVFGIGGVLLGLDTLISQAFGAKEIHAANRWLFHGIVLALALGLLLVGIIAFGPAVLNRMPVDRRVLAQAVPALYGLNWGVIPLLLYFTLRRYLQAAHHAKPIAFALISANLINFIGDWLLIYGHHWQFTLGPHSHVTSTYIIAIPAYQVVGSAWATSFARLYLMVVLAVAMLLADRRHKYGVVADIRSRTSRRIEFQHLRQLFRLGAPAGAQIFVEIAVFATVTALIATLGPLPLAGHEVALQLASTTFMVPYAISSATAVRVGHALGRVRTGHAQPGTASAAGWSGILAGAAFMLFAALTFLTIPGKLARIFTPDASVIAAAVPLVLVAAGFQFFDGIQITVTGALRGAGNTVAPFLTHLICYWVVGLPLGILFCFRQHLGAAGLWFGLMIALIGAAIVLLAVWRRTTRQLLAAKF